MTTSNLNTTIIYKNPRPLMGMGIFLLACVLIWQPSVPLLNLVAETISEAYLAVSTFVAGTLFLFYGVERILRVDLSERMAKAGIWQVPIAALLGALPGCGGAIIVVTRYTTGKLSFGAVLAVLTATMGDAAFLLIAKEPFTGAMVLVMGFVVGTLTGWLVDKVHGIEFLRPNPPKPASEGAEVRTEKQAFNPFMEKLWLMLFIPGLCFGVAGAFQIDVDALLANSIIDRPATLLGFASGILCLTMWLVPRFMPQMAGFQSGEDSYLRRVMTDTNFVTSWVVAAFLLFEISVFVFNIDISLMFKGLALWVPLAAILIGFIPGCGPQIMVTSLYLAGAIPLSAQLANAISNDGDALFPAIALAPKAAIVATLYSAVPALVIGYGWYFMIGS